MSQNEESKTHYRKAFHSPYLSSADIVDPITLTVQRVVLQDDLTKKTKDQFNTCYWVEKFIRPGEPLKPMILNATNSKFLAALSGSKWIEDWAGHQVTVYVDANVAFKKETVEGLRLSKAVTGPTASPELIAEAEGAARKGTAAYAEWFKNAGPDNRKLLATQHARLKRIAADADAKVKA